MDNYWDPDEELARAANELLTEFPVSVRLYVGVICIIIGLILCLLV